jgi:hypothetical protein
MGLPLITKAEYKAYAALTSPTQDAAIDTLIPKVSALVKSLCRRSFIDYVDESKVEVFNGGFAFNILHEFPVIAVGSVEQSLDYGQTYIALTEYTDYALNKTDDTLVPIGLSEFPTLINGYRVTYTAGYEVLPEDLKLAVMDLISYYIKNDMAVHSSKAPGTNSVQIEYVTTTNLPAHIKRVLDQYTANYA